MDLLDFCSRQVMLLPSRKDFSYFSTIPAWERACSAGKQLDSSKPHVGTDGLCLPLDMPKDPPSRVV
jgi:hypothetical protein